jgi:hypothetical protein
VAARRDNRHRRKKRCQATARPAAERLDQGVESGHENSRISVKISISLTEQKFYTILVVF